MTPEELKKEALSQLQNLQARILMDTIEIKEITIENVIDDVSAPGECRFTGEQILTTTYLDKEFKP